jgi:hypothetical protein
LGYELWSNIWGKSYAQYRGICYVMLCYVMRIHPQLSRTHTHILNRTCTSILSITHTTQCKVITTILTFNVTFFVRFIYSWLFESRRWLGICYVMLCYVMRYELHSVLGYMLCSILGYELLYYIWCMSYAQHWGRDRMINATFNNISVISWRFYWWRKPEYP